METEEIKKAFTAHKANGIYLNFPNGNALSTVWGSGTYSDNYDYGFKRTDGTFDAENFTKAYNERIKTGSDTVEVMPMCGDLVKKLLDAKFPDNENGSVFSRLTFPQWLEMVNILNENK